MIVINMLECTISILLILSIVILLIIIIEYEIDRRNRNKEIKQIHSDMRYRISSRAEQTIKYANALRYKLQSEMYIQSPKKNAIVKEVCDAFYEALLAQIKTSR